MKTQLLEDIGESAASAPLSSKSTGDTHAGKGARDLAPARQLPPARTRAAIGVWRQRIAEEPPALMTRPLEDAAPLELEKVFGELAALEAQFIRPEPQQALGASHAESLRQPDIALAEETTVPNATYTATAPQDPFFDFTPPAPAPQAANLFMPAPSALAQARKWPLIWAVCALSVALLVWGGRYLLQERNDAGSLALVASQAKGARRVDASSNERALAAATSSAQPGTNAPVPPPVPANAPLPDVPPLVMLEPDPPAAIKPEPAPRPAARRAAPLTAPKTVRAARQVPAAPVRKPMIHKTRQRSDLAAAPAKERPQREPVRQFARAPVVAAERPSPPDTSMAATLKACREHGYHASQCIKRQCSIGTYGFACRGR